MTGKAALTNRQARDQLAWLDKPIASAGLSEGVITVEDFIRHVNSVAEQLPRIPEFNYAINLCKNRYLFMVAFSAVMVRGLSNLLPSNKNQATQGRLQERYQGTLIVHDGEIELASGANINIARLDFSIKGKDLSPVIALDHVAAICFTSGSTGNAKAIAKTWRTFVESTEINSRYMLPNQDQTFYHLATVPSQHMWGLETTILMALRSPVCMVDAQPFYPSEVYSTLKKVPSPKALITTPLHLRSVDAAKDVAINVTNTLVATAPLSQELAASIEKKLNTQIREVYGCSEIGSMAVRDTAHSKYWQGFDGLKFKLLDDGKTTVSASYLNESAILDDQLEWLDNKRFILQGRSSDQINIGGKRGSLAEVNNVLLKFSELLDGVVIFPPQDRAVPRLVALVVLPKPSDKEKLKEHFRYYLDAVFVPRPIFLIESLPRAENGKLVKSQVLDLYRSLVDK